MRSGFTGTCECTRSPTVILKYVKYVELPKSELGLLSHIIDDYRFKIIMHAQYLLTEFVHKRTIF
jgi:hypothetical protein